VTVPEDKISAALAALLDKRNHPILIHCNKGKVSGLKHVDDHTYSSVASNRLFNWLFKKDTKLESYIHI
jgi:hypothetical protein